MENKTRRKLHLADLIRIRKTTPNLPVYGCYKINDTAMEFWCGRCIRPHRHGLDAEPFIPSPRVAHCRETLQVPGVTFDTLPPAGGYFVFWNGEEKESATDLTPF